MYICVYAICKNEEKFVERWMKSMSEADLVVVMDTGSTDNTVEKLKSLGAHVQCKIVDPWRFDVARNLSLELVPEEADVCVCTDLDEIFETGWRKKLEQSWRPDATQGSYRYTWNFLPDGSEGHVFWIEKIHSRHNYRWVHPVHEVLEFTGTGSPKVVPLPGIQLNHRADNGKSRAQYLPLLELSVKEAPEDDRNMHYLGREYYYHGQWAKAVATLTRHLSMPSATWKDERCASMRYIAKCKMMMQAEQESFAWMLRAVAEAPYLREPYMDLANDCYRRCDWSGVIYWVELALKIKEETKTYICEPSAWNETPYDLAAIASWHLGRKQDAVSYSERAIERSPENERLKANHSFYQQMKE